MSNFVLCWLHHCTDRSEKQVLNGRKFITLNEKTWCPVHLQVQGNLSRCFQAKNRLNQETFSDREDFPFRHQQVLGSNEPFFRFSFHANVAKSLLDGNRDHLLAETRSELMKQEYKVESLNTCISELQQQTCAQRLELEDALFGYAEPRREQVRLQEELVMKGKALRDTQIRSIHEMGELKRGQELRVDEFTVQKLRERHETIHRITSQIQELQERVNSMNDSGYFQVVESNHGGRVSYVPSQPEVIPSSPCWAATNACLLTHGIHGIHRDYRETFLAIHVLCSIQHRHLIKEFFTLRIQVPQVRFQCR